MVIEPVRCTTVGKEDLYVGEAGRSWSSTQGTKNPEVPAVKDPECKARRRGKRIRDGRLSLLTRSRPYLVFVMVGVSDGSMI